MVQKENNIKNYFGHAEDICQRLKGKEVFLFLDYDGTLTPIVDTPDKAMLSDDMRSLIKEAAKYYRVSVVSGRATDDVRRKVKLNDIYYAGSHGFEIISPDGAVTVNDEARRTQPIIDEAYEKLSEKLKTVAGALVEHVKFTISTHYRLVSDEDFPKIDAAVGEILKDYPQLRKTSGKKVFEIRPRIDWDKGKAVAWILKALHFDPQTCEAIYIGDDTTDEDAFAALEGRGFGILVSERARPTKAQYQVSTTEDVKRILKDMITVGESKS